VHKTAASATQLAKCIFMLHCFMLIHVLLAAREQTKTFI